MFAVTSNAKKPATIATGHIIIASYLTNYFESIIRSGSVSPAFAADLCHMLTVSADGLAAFASDLRHVLTIAANSESALTCAL